MSFPTKVKDPIPQYAQSTVYFELQHGWNNLSQRLLQKSYHNTITAITDLPFSRWDVFLPLFVVYNQGIQQQKQITHY